MEIEQFERRVLMSGNITLKIVRDQLRIIGDAEPNSFKIRAPSGAQGIDYSILTITGYDTTTIDEKPFISVVVDSQSPFWVSSISVNLGSGNDSALIAGEFGPYGLTVDLGDGDDSLSLEREWFTAVDVYGGDGNDKINVEGCNVDRTMQIFPGGGRDRTTLYATYIDRKLLIDDSGTSATIKLDTVNTKKKTEIITGNAADRVSISNCYLYQLSAL